MGNLSGVLKKGGNSNVQLIQEQSKRLLEEQKISEEEKVLTCIKELPAYLNECEQKLNDATSQGVLLKNRLNLENCKKLLEGINIDFFNKTLKDRAELVYQEYYLKDFNIRWSRVTEAPDLYKMIKTNVDTLYNRTLAATEVITGRTAIYREWTNIPSISNYENVNEIDGLPLEVTDLANITTFTVIGAKLKKTLSGYTLRGLYAVRFIDDKPVLKIDIDLRGGDNQEAIKAYEKFCKGAPLVGFNLVNMIELLELNGVSLINCIPKEYIETRIETIDNESKAINRVSESLYVQDLRSMFTLKTDMKSANLSYILSMLGVYTYESEGSQTCYYIGKGFVKLRDSLVNGTTLLTPYIVFGDKTTGLTGKSKKQKSKFLSEN
jgi:hypothetical protein